MWMKMFLNYKRKSSREKAHYVYVIFTYIYIYTHMRMYLCIHTLLGVYTHIFCARLIMKCVLVSSVK